MVLRPSPWFALWPGARGAAVHISMVSVPYTVGRYRKRDNEQQGYKELLFVIAAGHVEHVAE